MFELVFPDGFLYVFPAPAMRWPLAFVACPHAAEAATKVKRMAKIRERIRANVTRFHQKSNP